MTPRARRLVAVAAVLVLLLFVGRWLVGFLTDRWWAAAISPEALAAVTRWHLLGLALDAGAVLIASAWFAAQALLVARAIGSVQVEHRVGELRVREAVPVRLLLLGAVATGLVLGLITGIGARAWRAPVALAGQDVRYGVDDPLLGVDLGILVTEYPVWRLAQQFAVLLVLLGLAFALLLYIGIGAVRRHERRFELHPDARRHLGGLFALLALVLATGYLLGPYRLATAVDVPLGPAAASTRILAAHAAAGAAIAVAIISLGWALRARHTLLVASWAVLGLAATLERLVVPAFVAEAVSVETHAETARRYDGVFYGITMAGDAVANDTLPPVTAMWDVAALTAWAEQRGGELLGASPQGSGAGAHWVVATRPAAGAEAIEVLHVAEGVTTPAGLPVLTDGDSVAALLLLEPRIFPGAPDWRPAATGGVAVGGFLRRAAIAWARQAPGVFRLPGGASVDWSLDPQERLARLVPGLAWEAVGVVAHGGRLAWVVSGLATVGRAPLTARVPFGDATVAGVVPALIATVHADDGAVGIWVDPAADSLGHAWARVAGELVDPNASLPTWLEGVLPYPGNWFSAQLRVLERAHWGMGRRSTDPTSDESLGWTATWGTNGPRLQAVLEDPGRATPITLVEAGRLGRVALIAVTDLRDEELPGGDERARSWRRVPQLTQVRDSVRAAGDTLVGGPLRHHVGPAGAISWQAFRTAGRRGAPAIRWLATAHGPDIGGGRAPAEAWQSVFDPGAVSGDRVPFDVVSRYEAIRGWISRADSALARGDLTAFARAWEALRGLLLESPRE